MNCQQVLTSDENEEGITLVLVDQNNEATASHLLGGILGELGARIGIKTIVFAASDDDDDTAENTNGTTVQISDNDEGLNIKVGNSIDKWK